MVHRAPDSRLLTNLINNEKEYAKHLAGLFSLSNAALASLSAYAAASPSSHPASPAHTIAAVVDVLASADDALHRYTLAIDTWREQLVGLKNLEDDLSGVLRDRDILVTRLIKASKSACDGHRSSRLAPLTSIGSASFSSLPSTNSTAFSTTGSSPASANAKLAQAQAELQACEAHLVSKEQELDARRITLARDGLGARCRALIDCGWVWSEMGKQGLRALQALTADGNALKPSLSIPSRLSINPITYGSDHSSLTPSQSASQIAARSIETSHEDPACKEHKRVQQEEHRTSSKQLNNDPDLTISLQPVSEVAPPTIVRASHDNADSTASANTQPAPAPRRRRTKRASRPPSQHITEASDEGSDAAPSALRPSSANVSTRVPHTPFPAARAPDTHDTSSDDEPTGPLQVVENDPFEVIRRSMLGSPVTAPAARASAPDVRMSANMDPSPTAVAFLGFSSAHGHGQRLGLDSPPPGASPTKRQRRPSIAFFGSLRGLFRKPKERDRLGGAWEESLSTSPSPASPSRRARTNGWVTRTDARMKKRSGDDSDQEAVQTVTNKGTVTTSNVVRAPSGTRLRKGRPGPSTRENFSRTPSHRSTIDGWITDAPDRTGPGANTSMDASASGGPGRSRSTRRATMRRKKTSVADLRGSDQGHTDGEVDESLERSGKVKVPEVIISGPKLIEQAKQSPLPTVANPIVIPNATADASATVGLPKRAMTTTAMTSRKPSSDVSPAHRRSASLSFMDAHVLFVSAASSNSLSSQGTSQSMSWRKPPPQIGPLPASSSPAESPLSLPPPSQSELQVESQPRTLVESQAQSQPSPSSCTQDSQPKPNARRHPGNGHAKHAQSPSLMSIVADVTRQSREWERDKQRVMDKAKSLDMPRAPVCGERGGAQVSQGQGQGHGQQRVAKLPLRSALRNASRTPSPSPGVNANARGVNNREGTEEDRGRAVPSALRDSASISSYETGRESLDGEVEGEGASPSSRSPPLRVPSPTRAVPRSASQPPGIWARPPSPELSFTFPPPPVDPPPATIHGVSIPDSITGDETPLSSVSTSTETQPAQRRKSVRVSLQPTFSPAPPPALSDEDDGGKSKDVWVDSSEEDEAYSRARRLLSLVGR